MHEVHTVSQGCDSSFIREVTRTKLSTQCLHSKHVRGLCLQTMHSVVALSGGQTIHIAVTGHSVVWHILLVPQHKLCDPMTPITGRLIPANVDPGVAHSNAVGQGGTGWGCCR